MVAENPTYELSAEKLTEVALRVGRINFVLLRTAKRAGVAPLTVYGICRIGDNLRWGGGSAEFSAYRHLACEMIEQRMSSIPCFNLKYAVEIACEPPNMMPSHMAECRYCREEVESMQPVMAPS